MDKPSPPTDSNTFLAGIGHVCLQWALLEQTVLFIIGMVEGVPIEKAYVMFARLDMQPRLNMAIGLAEHARLPRRFIKPLTEIRKALQRDGDGLAERRNLFVHGAHQLGDVEGEFVLTMSRWKGDKQRQTVTFLDVAELSNQLALLVNKAQGVFDDYGLWKFGTNPYQDSDKQIAQANAGLRLIRAQQIKRGLKLIFANLKP